MMDWKLPKAVLVTGASSGIGRSIALMLGARGVRVAVGYHSGEDRAEGVVREIEVSDGTAVAVRGNLGEERDVARSFEVASDALGPLDGCVSNAGVQADAPIEEMSFADWRKPIALDLDGAFLTAREFLRRLPPRSEASERGANGAARAPRGTLVFVTSVHAFIPWAGHANYAAAKGGVTMLMRSAAQELASGGARVNAVAPGAVRTPINEAVWGDEERLRRLLDLIPYGRLGEAEDVAEAAAWLLSRRSDYVIGHTLVVDGGMSLYPGFIGNG